jgi:hypothetical protein
MDGSESNDIVLDKDIKDIRSINRSFDISTNNSTLINNGSPLDLNIITLNECIEFLLSKIRYYNYHIPIVYYIDDYHYKLMWDMMQIKINFHVVVQCAKGNNLQYCVITDDDNTVGDIHYTKDAFVCTFSNKEYKKLKECTDNLLSCLSTLLCSFMSYKY